MEAASLWPTEVPVGWLEAPLCCIAVWTWAAVAWAVAAVSWPVIVDEDGRAAFSIANLFCSFRNSCTLELNSSTKDPEGENA